MYLVSNMLPVVNVKKVGNKGKINYLAESSVLHLFFSTPKPYLDILTNVSASLSPMKGLYPDSRI